MAAADVSADDGRAIALNAQGFGSKRPAKPGLAHLRAVAQRLHAIQIDSVNVLTRAHYLPLFSRLGPYSMKTLDQLINERHELVEMDAHAASYVPVELYPLLRSRGRRAERWPASKARIDGERPGYVDAVDAEVVERGPLAFTDLADPARRSITPEQAGFVRRDGKPYSSASLMWWRPSDGKAVLDGLLSTNRLALAGRSRGFDRLYDLAERVIPQPILAAPEPPADEATRELLVRAVDALGVATVKEIAEYFRIGAATAKPLLRDLADEKRVQSVTVEGCNQPAYMSLAASTKRSRARCLLGPFDSLTWSRERTRRIFGFDYSFEIYVPAPKRRYGYYVLPFLLDGALVARVDLKADRKASALLVQGAYAEPTGPADTAVALADELRLMANWLELERVVVAPRGDLARSLRESSP
ncbi:MAG TPA: crosslink repair DNA glycosylase YcaQ family protein [Acidimicrobiales bacterium]|nr:crosslink repair DNA glycosylase YcaQ family protein [Acidimicrobiales bacterium]